MANYLERVASSAGRRAAIAKPPNSGPPVLPAGKDFTIAADDTFASEQDQFLDAFETPAPVRTEARAEIPATLNPEVAPEAKAPIIQKPTLFAPVEPAPKPRPTHERLSSEAPFTVQVPRTLRPVVAGVPRAVPTEPPREQLRVLTSTTVGADEPGRGEEPVPIVHSTEPDVSEPKPSAAPEVETNVLPARTKPAAVGPIEQHQAPLPKPVHTESAIAPIPRVDRVDGPTRQSVAEPSPLPAVPVHVPPVAGSATRQEQPRITIGSLEVLVNNHPKVAPARPAPAPSRNERFNLEKRYLDRFRLRH